jgi:hypothetical protein
MSKPITLIIPIEMTAAQIIRANPALENEALALAEELHAIIDATRERYAARPPGHPQDVTIPFELEDLIDAVRRTVLGFWPAGDMAPGSESMWVMEQLTYRCTTSDLYDRYLRLCERERLAA